MKLRLIRFFLFGAVVGIFAHDGKAQNTFNLTAPSTGVQPGAVAAITVNLAGTSNPAAVEFDVSPSTPADVTAMSATIAAAATAAMKQLACAPPTTTMSLHCIVYGQAHQTAIQPGALATISATISPGATPKAETFTLIQPEVSASPAAIALTVTIGTTATVSVLSPCDVNGDGVTNTVDTDAIVGWALGRAAPPPGFHCDLNGDGKCDAVDVQIVANAAAGLPCTGR